MTNLSDIAFNITGSKPLLILGFLIAIALSYLVYRRTVPPVSNAWRFLLMALRACSIILAILLLFKPILSITRSKSEKPLVAVLVDNSASMALTDKKIDRKKELQKVLNGNPFIQPSEDLQMQFFKFADGLSEDSEFASDSLDLRGDGTDIRNALELTKEALTEEHFSAVVLITDGADNLGENPARYAADYGVPIFPIAIGDPSEQQDIVISNYITNEVAYAGTRIPVDIYVKSNGYPDRRVPINLTLNNKPIDTQMIKLSDSGFEQKVRLYFTPDEEGLLKYEINVPPQAGELTSVNNKKTFYVKTLKSKLKLLLIAGGPGSDFMFLKRALASEKNYQLQAYLEKKNGRFYQGSLSLKVIKETDCIILLDYPRKNSSKQTLEQIKTVVAKGKPLFFMGGKNVDLNKLWLLKDFIPLATKPNKTSEQSVYLKFSSRGIYHPLFKLSENDFENRDAWLELPPIFSNLRNVKVKHGGQSLATTDVERTQNRGLKAEPLIVARTSAKRKSLAILAYEIWRWDFLMWGIGKSNDTYRSFLKNCIRWLTTTEDSKLVKITSNKEIYRSGEKIKFKGQVYFEDYQPVDDAEVVVQLKTNSETQELTLESIGDGRYEGSFQVLQGGDYQFTGTAHQQTRILGRDAGKFSVEEFRLEYQNTRMNEELLKRIASESGGFFYQSADFQGLKEKLVFPKRQITIDNEWEIWNRAPLLGLCLFFLSCEWFIRKRKGML